MSIKRISSTLIYNGISIKGISSTLIWNGMMIKGISTTLIIWNWNDDQRDLLYFDNLELKWWSKGSPLLQSSSKMMVKGISTTLIWNGNVDQRDLLYFDLEWNDDQRDLFYFDNLELKWWSKGSPLLWSGFGTMIKRDFLYFDLEWECQSKGSPLLQYGMKWWLKGSPLLRSEIEWWWKGSPLLW